MAGPGGTGGARDAVYANRRRIRGARGTRLLRQRGERLERPNAHLYETGRMRRVDLRGHPNILKRLLVQVCAVNLGLLMRHLTGVGTPRSLQGRAAVGDNLFSQSIVAVDVETGERVWHFQAIHHGVWDWDFPTAPTLMDITVDGRDIRALAQVSKQGFTYVFDRATGEPVWPIEERPVPPSDVPGEKLSPTQPHPTKPPAFEYQGVTEDLLIDFTPELRAEAVEILRQYAHGGMFTPQTLYDPNGTHGTLQVPGSGGGANWSGAGADPDTGFLYVPSRTGLTRMVLVEGKPSFTNLRYVPNGKLGPESIHPDRPPAVTGPRGLPLIKPPYSRLTAYDMNRGEIAWQTPTGPGQDRIRNHPALAGLDLPPLGGQMTTSGPLVTKTLVMLGLGPAGPNDSAVLAAYDKASGVQLGQAALPARPLGTPMTYSINGRQFIVLTLVGAQMVALALPSEP